MGKKGKNSSKTPIFLVEYNLDLFVRLYSWVTCVKNKASWNQLIFLQKQQKSIKSFSPCTVLVFGYRNDSSLVSSLLPTETNSVIANYLFDLLVFSNKAMSNGGFTVANAIVE